MASIKTRKTLFFCLFLLGNFYCDAQNIHQVNYEGNTYYTANNFSDLVQNLRSPNEIIQDGDWIYLNKNSKPIFKWKVKNQMVHGLFISYSGNQVCQKGYYHHDSTWSFLSNPTSDQYKIGAWESCISTFNSSGIKNGVETWYTKYYNCIADPLTQLWLDSINQNETIESYYLGAFGTKSDVHRYADSLCAMLTLNQKIELFDCASHVVKYYLFKEILRSNEHTAHELLMKYIEDKSRISTHFTCVLSSHKFNQLLFDHYSSYCYSKYNIGGRQFRSGVLYEFPKKNKKAWRKKRKELRKLIKEYQIYPDDLKGANKLYL